MDKIVRKIYDNRITLPSDMLKTLGITRGDSIEVIEVDNGILLQKLDSSQEVDKQDQKTQLITEVKNNNDNKKYKLTVDKKCDITIPKEIFDKYNLAENFYTTLHTNYPDKDGQVYYWLILSKSGSYRYRKENRVSLRQIFPDVKFEPGQTIYLTEYTSKKLTLSVTPKIKNDMKSGEKELSQNNNSLEEDSEKITSLESFILNFKARIGKRYVITVPIKIFSKMKQMGLKFDYIINHDGENVKLILSINENGKFSFQKSGAMTLKALMEPIQLQVGGDVFGEYDKVNNIMSLTFPKESIIENPQQSQEITEDTKLVVHHIGTPNEKILEIKHEEQDKNLTVVPKEWHHTEDIKINKPIEEDPDELDENEVGEIIEDEDLDTKEQYYRYQIERFKSQGVKFQFIDKDQIPHERTCFRCSKILGPNDNSMLHGHRICNECKHNYLKKLFTPIRELSKIKAERGERHD